MEHVLPTLPGFHGAASAPAPAWLPREEGAGAPETRLSRQPQDPWTRGLMRGAHPRPVQELCALGAQSILLNNIPKTCFIRTI